ncbi:GNAT family N-acetyltransferase [Oceanivirga salmonicida]|uniref:GNAT family N-acetyltransferase n=1 Tax=Oceanivirga salmonicida TaxID=1769291 RepID=UPI0008335E62|nr:GNAT family N-acetyltransferase [Oceanivirga salmonicida]
MKIVKSSSDDIDYIENMLLIHNKESLKLTQRTPYKVFSYVIKSDSNKIIGGIVGCSVLWKILYIETLWVDKNYRNKKYGTKLLNKLLSDAKKYGCRIAHLDSFDFQGYEFYLKNGFEIFGVLENSPENHKEFFLKKVLI